MRSLFQGIHCFLARAFVFLCMVPLNDAMNGEGISKEVVRYFLCMGILPLLTPGPVWIVAHVHAATSDALRRFRLAFVIRTNMPLKTVVALPHSIISHGHCISAVLLVLVLALRVCLEFTPP